MGGQIEKKAKQADQVGGRWVGHDKGRKRRSMDRQRKVRLSLSQSRTCRRQAGLTNRNVSHTTDNLTFKVLEFILHMTLKKVLMAEYIYIFHRTKCSAMISVLVFLAFLYIHIIAGALLYFLALETIKCKPKRPEDTGDSFYKLTNSTSVILFLAH